MTYERQKVVNYKTFFENRAKDVKKFKKEKNQVDFDKLAKLVTKK